MCGLAILVQVSLSFLLAAGFGKQADKAAVGAVA